MASQTTDNSLFVQEFAKAYMKGNFKIRLTVLSWGNSPEIVS